MKFHKSLMTLNKIIPLVIFVTLGRCRTLTTPPPTEEYLLKNMIETFF